MLKPFNELLSGFLFCNLFCKTNYNEKNIFNRVFTDNYTPIFSRIFYGNGKKHETKKHWPGWNERTCNCY